MTVVNLRGAWYVASVVVFAAACQAHPVQMSPTLTAHDLSTYLMERENRVRSAIESAEACISAAKAAPNGSSNLTSNYVPVPGELTVAGARERGYDALAEATFATSEFVEVAGREVAGSNSSSAGAEPVVLEMTFGEGRMTASFGPCAAASLELEFGSLDEGAWSLFALDYLFSSTDEGRLAQVVDEALPDWSGCMAEMDYAFDNPRAAWLAAEDDAASAPAIALADATCREEEGLNAAIRERVLGDVEALVGRDSIATKYIAELLSNQGVRHD